MVKVVISHKIKDYQTWRPIFDADRDRRIKNGVRNERVYRDANDENNIYITGETDDPSMVNEMFNDPDLASKMQEAGVISEPIVTVLKPV